MSPKRSDGQPRRRWAVVLLLALAAAALPTAVVSFLVGCKGVLRR